MSTAWSDMIASGLKALRSNEYAKTYLKLDKSVYKNNKTDKNVRTKDSTSSTERPLTLAILDDIVEEGRLEPRVWDTVDSHIGVLRGGPVGYGYGPGFVEVEARAHARQQQAFDDAVQRARRFEEQRFYLFTSQPDWRVEGYEAAPAWLEALDETCVRGERL